MIIQFLLDVFSDAVGGFLDLVPDLPAEADTAMDDLSSAAATVGGIAAKAGPVIPWNAMTTCVGIFVGLMGFWLAILGTRAVLWLLNR